MEKIRIAKYLAIKNICSRREAEKHIENGNVTVNGTTIHSPIVFVNDEDNITFCGKKIDFGEKKVKLWIYYKPIGEITTHNDPQHRRTVFESISQKGLTRVISVGRLDINSEGLLLLTNDSALAHSLECSRDTKRIYKVRAFGILDKKIAQKYKVKEDEIFFNTIKIKNIYCKKVHIKFKKSINDLYSLKVPQNFWGTVTLTEGKNREIRKIMNYMGLQINRLIRTNFGPYAIKNMKVGELKEININRMNF